MTLAIITHTVHIGNPKQWFAYGPYVREMNIWIAHAESIIVTAPIAKEAPTDIHLPYLHQNLRVSQIPAVSLTSFGALLKAVFYAPFIFYRIFIAMYKADHIHLRCPGNIGLMGCLVQMWFPFKKKTAKYAGNWDPKSRQPLSYRFQKWILANTFLTRNMQVLVYGDWPGQSRNVKAFFTASYPKPKSEEASPRIFMAPFKFIFAGSLSPGKRPMYAVRLIETLYRKGLNCTLDLYGEGSEREELVDYIAEKRLQDFIILHGNKTALVLEKAYKRAHFLILPSRSEGWPKVVAEAMFWGAIPVVTSISCVPWMLDFGSRGILIDANLENDLKVLQKNLRNPAVLERMSHDAQQWSHNYNLDAFADEIKKLVT